MSASMKLYGEIIFPMAAVQAEDIHASFLLVCDLNGHHQEWSDSTTTNHHGVAAFASQLSLVELSWLSAQPMHVVEHLI